MFLLVAIRFNPVANMRERLESPTLRQDLCKSMDLTLMVPAKYRPAVRGAATTVANKIAPGLGDVAKLRYGITDQIAKRNGFNLSA